MVRPERFELPTPCFVGKTRSANSLNMRHGWQRKSTLRHAQDIQVVLKWYAA
jgi:hypothetical protein